MIGRPGGRPSWSRGHGSGVPAAKRLTPAKLAVIVVLLAGLTWYAAQVLRPALPITVQFQSEVGGSGFALRFRNDSDRALTFTATLEHPRQSQASKYLVQVQPHDTYELGSSRGWVGESGDRISLSSSDYRKWTGAIP